MIRLIDTGIPSRFYQRLWLYPDRPIVIQSAVIAMKIIVRAGKSHARLAIKAPDAASETLRRLEPIPFWFDTSGQNSPLIVRPRAIELGAKDYPLRIQIELGVDLPNAADLLLSHATDRR